MKFFSRLVVPFVVFAAGVEVAVSAFGGVLVHFDSTSRCRYRRATTSSSTTTTVHNSDISRSLHDKQHQQQPENDWTPTVPSKKEALSLPQDHLSKGLIAGTTTTSLLFSLSLFLLVSFSPALSAPAMASSYTTALSEEQKVVAEAWRLVDNSFLDRTFNGQDWFQLRQSLVTRTSTRRTRPLMK
jgi:hypothetical protein